MKNKRIEENWRKISCKEWIWKSIERNFLQIIKIKENQRKICCKEWKCKRIEEKSLTKNENETRIEEKSLTKNGNKRESKNSQNHCYVIPVMVLKQETECSS